MGVRIRRTWRTSRSKVERGHLVCMLSHFSRVRRFMPPRTGARQAPLSMGSSRQECWSGLPCFPQESNPSLTSTCTGRRVLYLKRHVGSPGDHYSSAQRLRALRKGGVAVTPRVRFPEPSGVHSSPSPSPRGTQADVPIGQKAWPSG